MELPEITDNIDAFEDVLVSTLQLVRQLTSQDATRTTDCPGWTVQDQLSHMVGLEQVLAGSPPPAVAVPDLPHVHGDLGRLMESISLVRRDLPLAAVADELAGLLPRRMEQLRAAAAQGDPDVMGPMGPRKLSAAMQVRVFDLWAHEQDIRRAMGMPARIDCAAAGVALHRSLTAWETVLPGAVDELNGRLVVTASGPHAATRTYTFGAGDGGSAQLRGDVGSLTWLACGRGKPESLGDAISFDGDAAVIAAVGPALGFTP
jgi:uncharacterized protein (TIGR03083 family)